MFLILLSLTDTDRHGLGIVDETEARTAGEVKLGPGLLYGSLKRLLSRGLVDEPARRPPAERDDPRRRYYRITAAGRRALRDEAERLERWVDAAREKRVLRTSR
jgi:DNA-binding PadR family transcriptional regulator